MRTGRLTKAHMHSLFKKVFPGGDSETFCDHIYRIFDSDGNGYLDFKVNTLCRRRQSLSEALRLVAKVTLFSGISHGIRCHVMQGRARKVAMGFPTIRCRLVGKHQPRGGARNNGNSRRGKWIT